MTYEPAHSLPSLLSAACCLNDDMEEHLLLLVLEVQGNRFWYQLAPHPPQPCPTTSFLGHQHILLKLSRLLSSLFPCVRLDVFHLHRHSTSHFYFPFPLCLDECIVVCIIFPASWFLYCLIPSVPVSFAPALSSPFVAEATRDKTSLVSSLRSCLFCLYQKIVL